MKRLTVFILLAVFSLSSWRLYHTLAQDRFLRGTDAYYYALQANYWAKTGEVKIPDSSFIHRITGALQHTGLSTEAAVRLWETTSLCLFFFTALGLILLPHGVPKFSATLILLYLGISPSLLFTALEFPKFFSMLILIPLWFYPLIDQRKWWLGIVVILITCAFHRAALPLAIGFGAMTLLPKIRPYFAKNRVRWILLLGMIAILAMVYVLGTQDRFHLLDLDRITWKDPQIGVLTLLRRENLPPVIKLEMFASALLFLVFAIRFWRSHPEKRAQLLIPLSLFLPACFPFGSEEVFGVGERYAILLPTLLLLGILFLLAMEPPEPSWSLAKKICFAVLALAVPILSGLRLGLAHPRSLDPNFADYDQVTAELQALPIPMLIAHKRMVFYYKFKLMREAFPYEPETHWDKTRIWRLLYKIAPEELNYYLSEACNLQSGLWKPLAVKDYSLVREDCWEALRRKLTREDNSDLYHRAWETWLNPAQPRPAFLYPKHERDKDLEFPAFPPKN